MRGKECDLLLHSGVLRALLEIVATRTLPPQGGIAGSGGGRRLAHRSVTERGFKGES